MSRGESEAIMIGSDLPIITKVRTADNFQVEVGWRHGTNCHVDLAPDILAFKIYAPLRNSRELFETVTVTDDGNAISWGDGEIDMPATAVERLATNNLKA